MSKLKTAVVGVGALGRHHLKWMSQLTDSQLIGVFDIDQTPGQKLVDAAVAIHENYDDAREKVATPLPRIEKLAAEAIDLVDNGTELDVYVADGGGE